MQKTTIHSYLVIFTLALIAGGIAMGIAGAVIFPREKNDEAKASPTTCNFTSYEVVSDTCFSNDCTSNDNGCTARVYTCYYPKWVVNYVISNSSQVQTFYTGIDKFDSPTRADQEGQSLMQPNIRPCYYIIDELQRVRLTQPNPAPFMGLLIAGWIIFAVGGVGIGVLWVTKGWFGLT